MKGLITKSTGSWYQVLDLETRQVFEARIRGKFKLIKTRLTNPLAVGDFVEFQLEKDDIAWITKIEPRKNYLIRKSCNYRDWETDRKSTRLNSSHRSLSRMPSSA